MYLAHNGTGAYHKAWVASGDAEGKNHSPFLDLITSRYRETLPDPQAQFHFRRNWDPPLGKKAWTMPRLRKIWHRVCMASKYLVMKEGKKRKRRKKRKGKKKERKKRRKKGGKEGRREERMEGWKKGREGRLKHINQKYFISQRE